MLGSYIVVFLFIGLVQISYLLSFKINKTNIVLSIFKLNLTHAIYYTMEIHLSSKNNILCSLKYLLTFCNC